MNTSAYTFRPARYGSGYDIVRRGSCRIVDRQATRFKAERSVGELNRLLLMLAPLTPPEPVSKVAIAPDKPKSKRNRFSIPAGHIDHWVERALSHKTEYSLNVEMSKKYGMGISTLNRCCFRQMPSHYKFFKRGRRVCSMAK